MKRVLKIRTTKTVASKKIPDISNISNISKISKISKISNISKICTSNKILLGLILINLYVFCFGFSILIGDSEPVKDIECNTNPNIAQKLKKIPHYYLDLDQPPETRWNHIVKSYSKEIENLLNTVEQSMIYPFREFLFGIAQKYFPEIPYELHDYGKELIGISNTTGISLSRITLYNIFYEIFAMCTSIVAETEDNHIIHARNMDFGLFMNAITPILADLTIDVTVVKNRVVLYRSHTFAGYIGVLSAMKPLKYVITANQRFDWDGGFIGIYEWLKGNHTLNWDTLLTRDVIENQDTYQQVLDKLTSEPLVAPIYYIVSGTRHGEGAIITRDRTTTVNILYLNGTSHFNPSQSQSQSKSKSKSKISIEDDLNLSHDSYYSNKIYSSSQLQKSNQKQNIQAKEKQNIQAKEKQQTNLKSNQDSKHWYLVETNYDNWKPPLFIDDRRTPAKHCIEQIGQKNINLTGLLSVLSTKPVLNKLSIFSALMSSEYNIFEGYIQNCSDPCPYL